MGAFFPVRSELVNDKPITVTRLAEDYLVRHKIIRILTVLSQINGRFLQSGLFRYHKLAHVAYCSSTTLKYRHCEVASDHERRKEAR